MANILNRFHEEEEVDLQQTKYLTFIVDRQYYAFPIKDIIEIIEVQDITFVPEAPDYVKGVINVRGRIIPVIDVRLRFRRQEAEYTERTCIVIVKIGEVEIGFVVDTVDEVVDLQDENISAPPKVQTDRSARYITGVGKIDERIVLLLDAEKMFSEDELGDLAEMQ